MSRKSILCLVLSLLFLPLASTASLQDTSNFGENPRLPNVLENRQQLSSINYAGHLTAENAEKEIAAFLSSAAIGANSEDLKLTGIQQSGDRLFVAYGQQHNGIPVYGARSVFYAKNGRLSFARVNYYSGINTDVSPKLTKEQAAQIAATHYSYSKLNSNSTEKTTFAGKVKTSEQLGSFSVPSVKSDATDLVVFPVSKEKQYLAWEVYLQDEDSDLSYFVDANNGAILGARDNRLYYNISGTVSGRVWEDPFTEGGQTDRNFSNLALSIGEFSLLTDENGHYSATELNNPTSVFANLSGPWVNVTNFQQPKSVHSAPISNETAVHDWNWDVDDNSYLDEESNVFYHVNRFHDFAKSLGTNEVDFTMNAYVNDYSSCNAYYSRPSKVVFFKANSRCESTGVLPDVIYHEYGHGMIDRLDPSLLDVGGYYAESGNLHEGLADYWACTLTNNAILAEGFYKGVNEGLRRCDSSDHYPENYNSEPHSGAQIVSGAMWGVRLALGENYTDHMLVDALRLQPVSFSELITSMLVIDDDNGNLADGTPNINAICDAFYDRGLASGACAGFTSKPLAALFSPGSRDHLFLGSLPSDRGSVPVIGIAYPSRNAVMNSYVLTANVNGYDTIIHTGYSSVANGTLYDWNTIYFPENTLINLSLKVTDSNGQGSLANTYVKLDNIYFSNLPNSIVRSDGIIELNGTVQNGGFTGYMIEYAPYLTSNWASEGISLANNGALPVTDGTLATWDTSVVPFAGAYTLAIRAFGESEKREYYYVRLITPPQIINSTLLPSSVGTNQTVQFSAIANDTEDLSWSIEWGDGAVQVGACPASSAGRTFAAQHSYQYRGAFTVTATVSDCQRGSANVSHLVTVLWRPTCSNGQQIGDVDGNGRIQAYDAAIVSKILNNQMAMPADICCSDANMDNNLTAADVEKILRINAGLEQSPGACGYTPPQIANSTLTPSSILLNQTVQFAAVAYDQDNLSWSINWGDGTGQLGSCPASSAGRTFAAQHTYASKGTFTVLATANDCNGGTANVSHTVSVWDLTCRNGQQIGDVDGNGRIQAYDAALVSKIINNQIPRPADICCSDANMDNVLTAADAEKILRINAGLEQSPGVCTNNPPAINVVSKPPSLLANQIGTFKWYASDDRNVKLNWTIYWGDGTTSVPQPGSQNQCIDSLCRSVSFRHKWGSAGVYGINATVSDGFGTATNVSSMNIASRAGGKTPAAS